MSSTRSGIFAGDDPFEIARGWLAAAEADEPNDANAMALATSGRDGLPNVRMVLLKDIEPNGFVFYTNYDSRKGEELEQNAQAAFVIHWKSLRRQIRARGKVTRVGGKKADDYYSSRSLPSRLGAWASKQSRPLANRRTLMAEVARITATKGTNPKRPPFWGGFLITPTEIEFWADGAHRLHDRFRFTRLRPDAPWSDTRLHP